MKTKFLCLFTFISFLAFQKANAKIWRVNNVSNFNGTTLFGDNLGGTATNPVFDEINSTMSWTPVKDEDTLHIEGSAKNYKAASVTKKLVIIGLGYFLSDNPKSSANPFSSNIGSVTFDTGSEGSQLIGVNVISEYPFNITIKVSNVIVKRCRIENTLHLGSDVSNINILQNFFSNTSKDNALVLDYPFVYPTDIVFNNNICQKTLLWDGTLLQCNNNVFDGPANVLNLKFSTGEFQNNILKPLNATVDINNGTNQNVKYNIGSSESQFGTGSANTVVIDMSTLFINSSGQSTDASYQFKANSAGSNNGSDGTDRGAFGGTAVTNRYTLSGLAPIPVIYGIVTPAAATPTGLKVTINARTIK